eukprot:scaffold15772_cov36-Phaeocystis_antarctica.AAC.1
MPERRLERTREHQLTGALQAPPEASTGSFQVPRPAVAAWLNHHAVIGGSCAAREQRWNGQITLPRPLPCYL